MHVIALATLIVKADDAHTVTDVHQAVFETVRGRRDWRGDLPNDLLNETAIGQFTPGLIDEDRLVFHVANYDNNRRRCQPHRRNAILPGPTLRT